MDKKIVFFFSISIVCIWMLLAWGCENKSKEIVLSTNVEMDMKNQQNQIYENINQGDQYLDKNKYEDAKKSYESAISNDKSNKKVYLDIKDSYVKRGMYKDAYYILRLAENNNINDEEIRIEMETIKKNIDWSNE